jgi:threonine/homoserine/homoserine lactone efflux protein
MVTIAVITLSRKKLQERASRWLKLTGGAVMLSLGLVLILKPEWLAL